MRRSSIAVLAAVLLATSPIVATSAFAQMTDMDAVESSVTSELAKIGVNDVDISILTLKQLQEIKLVAESEGNMADKQQQIRAIADRKPGSQAD